MSLSDLVRIANNKFGFHVLPEQFYYDLNGSLRNDWMLDDVNRIFKNQSTARKDTQHLGS